MALLSSAFFGDHQASVGRELPVRDLCCWWVMTVPACWWNLSLSHSDSLSTSWHPAELLHLSTSPGLGHPSAPFSPQPSMPGEPRTPRLRAVVLSAFLIFALTSAPVPTHRRWREEPHLSGRAARSELRFEGTRLGCGSD